MKLFKKRKKGSIILEFIIVIPVIYFASVAAMFIIQYSSAQNIMQHAGLEGARILTQELRGNTGKIPDTDEIKGLLLNKVENSVKYNNYILLFHDSKNRKQTPAVVIEPSDKCSNALKSNERVICAYTETNSANGIEQQQVIVLVKSKFYVLINFVPGIKNNTFATGKGSSEKEFSGRFNYWE